MNGLEKNVRRLFSNEGKLFLTAFDHPQIYGKTEGLTDPIGLMRKLKDNIDGTIFNPGILRNVPADEFYDKKLVMRGSLGGTMMAKDLSTCHKVIVSPSTILSQGADAVLLMLVLGGESDIESMTEVTRACDTFHQHHIPVIVEVLASDFSKNNEHDFVVSGARVAAELGADVVKAFYCEGFEEVVRECPVPIVLAGGAKGADICDTAREVVKAGVKGFAFGRNIFQAEDPAAITKELAEILHS